MPQAQSFDRHDFVWLDPASRQDLADPLRAAGNAQDADALQAWVGAQRPFVVSRQPEGLPEGSLAAGLPLPPAQGKRRIAVHFSREAILRGRPALALVDALDAAPPSWRQPLRALLAQQRLAPLQVFGSLAWQCMTGLEYVTPASDLDLLWDARDAEVRRRTCAALQQWQQAHGIAVDGEMRFGQGRAVSWREWMRTGEGGRATVLVKHLHGAWLCEADQLAAPC